MKEQKPVAEAAELGSMRLQQLMRYWQSRRHDNALPGRADIDPLDMPWILGDLSLIEVHRKGSDLRYRFRLVGSRVAARFGFDPTGRWLDDFPVPEYRRHLAAAFADVVLRAQPCVEQPDMMIHMARQAYEVLRLPLADNGRQVDMLMVAVDFGDA